MKPADCTKPVPAIATSQDVGVPEAILASLRTGVICTDANGQVQYINAAAAKLTGWAGTTATGCMLQDILRPLVDDPEDADKLIRLLLDPGGQAGILLHQDRPNGVLPELHLASTPLLDSGGRNKGIVVSITEQANTPLVLENRIAQNTDAMTGLLNRNGLVQRLETLIDDANTSCRTHALVMLDMDQFKLINDLSGHRAGDALLRRLARQLAEEIHKGDTIARLGGDEFGFLLCNLEASEAVAVSRRLLAAVAALQFTWDGRIYPLSASIGIVPITETSGSAIIAMSQADSALYAAKDAGRNRCHIYTPEDDVLSRRHSEMEWAGRISQALEQGQFRLAMQRIAPILVDEKGDHFEVLLRLQDGDELVSPAGFIPAAERYGLMGKIDRWVVESFIDFLEQNPKTAEQISLCAINLSGHSLVDEDFLEFLTRQLGRPHVRPESLCFEVTETAAINNFAHANRFIEKIHALGCQLSLDDFGSGMSSFGYLRQLPVDYLKIDGVFVRDMDSDPVHSAMVKAINEIGHVMGKKTIAEFVGNADVLHKLQEMGVDYAQGYHLGKPQLLQSTMPMH